MSRAVLSIGSNVGDRQAHLRGAVRGLADVLVAASPVYETQPWGGVAQEPFLNAVLAVRGDLTPAQWLHRAQALERAAGRRRAVRWGPRTLDVDIVQIDGVRSTAPELILPHPRAHERAFVLVPWLDLDPAAELDGRPVATLLSTMDTADVRRREDLVIAA